jgi:hypothetical protein
MSDRHQRFTKQELTFSLPRLVNLLQNLHGVRTTAANLTVPKEETLGLNVPVDEAADRGPEGLLLVRSCHAASSISGYLEGMRTILTNPNEVPVGRLDTSRQCRADAGTGADTDAALVERRRVRDTSKLDRAG